MQFPSNILVSRIPRPGLCKFRPSLVEEYAWMPFLTIGLDICCMATIWGAVSACTAAVQTKEALYAVRVVLGIAEAAYFPGAVGSLSSRIDRRKVVV